MFVSIPLLVNVLFVLIFITDADAKTPAAPRKVGNFEHFVRTMGTFIRDVYSGFARSGSGPRFGLLFALLPVGAMALAYAILGTIQVDYGLNEIQISQLALASALTTAFGCFVGGILGDRFGVKRITAIFYFMTIIPTLILAYQISTTGLTNIPIMLFRTLILSHSLLFGMAFAVRIAMFMGMTNPAVAATQFTAYMALSNMAISMGNYWQGMVAERMDYAVVLTLDAAIVTLALCVLPFLKDREEKPATPANLSEQRVPV